MRTAILETIIYEGAVSLGSRIVGRYLLYRISESDSIIVVVLYHEQRAAEDTNGPGNPGAGNSLSKLALTSPP